MKFSRTYVLALSAILCILCRADLATAQANAKKTAAKAPDPVMASIADDPRLPRVLLIGDSISMGYTLPVREALKGKANVHHPPENCGPTTRGIEKLDSWLGKDSWNVIHFNFGLHDLKFVESEHQVSPKDYEKNLREIVKRLKQTGAVLIWCSTTPALNTANPPRHNEDVLAYNAAAKKIMDENGILINDLYAVSMPQIKKIQRPKNVHFTGEGYKVLAGEVAKFILEALKGKTAPKK